MPRSPLPCRTEDPELWFPTGTGLVAVEQTWLAKALCDGCPIKQACLNWALQTGEQYGIWGGTDEDERRAMRRHNHVHRRGPNEDHRTRTDLVRELASQA